MTKVIGVFYIVSLILAFKAGEKYRCYITKFILNVKDKIKDKVIACTLAVCITIIISTNFIGKISKNININETFYYVTLPMFFAFIIGIFKEKITAFFKENSEYEESNSNRLKEQEKPKKINRLFFKSAMDALEYQKEFMENNLSDKKAYPAVIVTITNDPPVDGYHVFYTIKIANDYKYTNKISTVFAIRHPDIKKNFKPEDFVLVYIINHNYIIIDQLKPELNIDNMKWESI